MQTHSIRRLLLSLTAGASVWLGIARVSSAVILYRSAIENTTAPAGVYANSGWQYAGAFGPFMATPIAPNWIITAGHIGNYNTFTYPGGTYNVDTSFIGGEPGWNGPGWVQVPNTDIRLWKLQGSMPTWASLWDQSVDGSEVGKELVAIGRGTKRGAPLYGLAGAPRDGVRGPGSRVPVTEHKGWLWQPYDTDTHDQSWGANNVDTIFNGAPYGLGDLLTFDFDRISPLTEESALSNGDSGGAVFIKSPTTGVWKLGGVNFSVDGPFRQRIGSENIFGSLFDMGGMYLVDNPPTLVPDGATDVPGSSYASRMSSNLAYIRSITGNPGPSPITNAPEPAASALAVFAVGSFALRRPRCRRA